MDYYLGIDAGTSGLKVVAIDAHGAMRGTGSAPYRLSTPRPGWAEADPHDWWTALCAAIRQLLVTARIDAAQIVAVSFSGQMHTLVLLDAQYVPVRPAISWADTRGSDERREIEGRIGRTRLIEITGSPAVTAFTATKLLWVRRHEPEVWPRARVAMLCKDFLRWRLTGTVATDPTDAGATGLLDVRAREWAQPVLDALDIPRALLPPIAPSTARAGHVSPTAASETGLRAGTIVGIGAGDQECAALGCGVIDSGPLLMTLGTGGQVFAATTTSVIDPLGRVHTLPHALVDRWHILAAIPAAGLALEWASRVLAAPQESGEPLSAEPPIFVPDVAGARTPSMDEQARGVFVGLALDHTARDLSFAVREGVAFALRACVETLNELGVPSDPLLVTGGLSVDGDFLPLLADVLNRPLQRASHPEGSGYGAALLAASAAGRPLPSPAVAGAGLRYRPRAAHAVWHARRYAAFRGARQHSAHNMSNRDILHETRGNGPVLLEENT